MIYIRTGDKISEPFTIPLWSKILAAGFACYFFWITVEYIKIVFLEPEIARIEQLTANKYMMMERIDEASLDFSSIESNSVLINEILLKEEPK